MLPVLKGPNKKVQKKLKKNINSKPGPETIFVHTHITLMACSFWGAESAKENEGFQQ